MINAVFISSLKLQCQPNTWPLEAAVNSRHLWGVEERTESGRGDFGFWALPKDGRKEGREEKKRKEGKSERTNGRHQFLGDYTARGRVRARKMEVGGTESRENIPMLVSPTYLAEVA